jgi:hypothetical protein
MSSTEQRNWVAFECGCLADQHHIIGCTRCIAVEWSGVNFRHTISDPCHAIGGAHVWCSSYRYWDNRGNHRHYHFLCRFGCLRACVAGPKSQSRQNSQIPINLSMSLASIASITDTRLRDAYQRAPAMPRQSIPRNMRLVRKIVVGCGVLLVLH